VKTPRGTSVGVEDPYEHVDRCDHVTDDGRCRFAVERAERDPSFAAERRADDLRCPAAAFEARVAADRAVSDDPEAGEWRWADCSHFRSREHDDTCARCGLAERRVDGERPLLEEHHLSYADEPAAGMDHEITVALCRWCHAKVHGSWARIDDDAAPDPEALAAAEGRRSAELAETAFRTAAERADRERDG
jgi:hypothetical protein